MKIDILIAFLICLSFSLNAQTVPVTFHVDVNNTQYETVQMWHMPDIFTFTDDDGDRIFELTLDLAPGNFGYHILRDNAWGWDPDNPTHPNGYPSDGASMQVSDPMISYLLPKDGYMMLKNRIQANLAYTLNNPPLENTIAVTINGNLVDNAAQYFNASKRELLINNPPFLVNGSNTVSVAYSTSKGSISRSSSFLYQPIKLMIDSSTYRMDHILGWGRVFSQPLPAQVYVACNGKEYQASVNTEGYFGADIDILDGENTVTVAYNQTGLSDPVDQMTVNAEIRHKWWIELTDTIIETTATIQSIPHDIAGGAFSYEWRQADDNPSGLSISGNTSSLSFTVPEQEGNYSIELQVTTNSGEKYTARKLLTTKGKSHFIDVNERAPWMDTMIVYEVEGDFFDWGQFSFQNMKKTFQHMKDLGVNCFRFTPFVQGGFISWNHFDIYPPYGTINDLKDMVATAHQYGLKVLFDVPLSHTAPFHPFILPNFLLKQNAEPYYNFNLWQGSPGESDVIFSPDNGRQCVYTNLDNTYTQEYFTRLMEYWVEVAGCDGFRIDCGQESFLRSPDYIKNLHKRLRNIKPNLFILEEGDNRDHKDVNYYDFGDAAYDWQLNTQWGGGTKGIPGIFGGTYSVDQLHELLTSGTPDSGLVMRYANTGYFDYLSKLYSLEQERSAVALITTTYGLPNIRAGEEVGLVRGSGMYDLSDPLDVMPFYKRLINIRKTFLGNYPNIERFSENIPNDVYAYASKSNGNIVFTIINFSAVEINCDVNLNNTIFEDKGKNYWYNIVDDISLDNTGKESMSVLLGAWQAKVFVVNPPKEESASVQVTFQVDMQKETVSSQGVFLRGSFNNWTSTTPLIVNGTVYSTTLELTADKTIQYKFVNGDTWESDIPNDCGVSDNNNRELLIPDKDTILNGVCFNSCDKCITTSIEESLVSDILVYPNPGDGKMFISGLPNDNIRIRVFSIDGRLLIEKASKQLATQQIDLSKLTPGIYHLKIMGEKWSRTFKIIRK